MDGPSLTFQIATSAVRLAGHLRMHFQRRGMSVVAPGASPPLDAVSVTLTRVSLRVTRLDIVPLEAVEDGLAKSLSQHLRVPVTAVLRGDGVVGIERAKAGTIACRLVMRGDEVLAAEGAGITADHAEQLIAAATDAGWLAFDPRTADAKAKSIALHFTAPAGSASEVIEVDPLITCPDCGSPTLLRTAQFGEFYGCVRFPACRGRVTTKRAEALRASLSGDG